MAGVITANVYEALQAMKNGLPMREALRLFNVSKADLGIHWNNYLRNEQLKHEKNTLKHNSETLRTVKEYLDNSPNLIPDFSLLESEENTLYEYLNYVVAHGFPLCVETLESYIVQLGLLKTKVAGKYFLNHEWLQCYTKRYNLPNIIPLTIEDARARLVSDEGLGNFFDLLKLTLDKYCLHDKQTQIWYSEESNFEENHNSETKSGALHVGFKHAYLKEMMSKEKIVINVCISAAGDKQPPMVVFGELSEDPNMFAGPKGSLYGFSKEGFGDESLCTRWFKHFLHYAPKERPLLLILDQMDFHLVPPVIDLAQQNEVIMLFMPLHCHPILRPLDVSLFIQTSHVDGSHFCSLIKDAYESITPEIIIHGFRKTGIWPYDPKQVNFEKIFGPVTQRFSDLINVDAKFEVKAKTNGYDLEHNDGVPEKLPLKNNHYESDDGLKSDHSVEDAQVKSIRKRKRNASESSLSSSSSDDSKSDEESSPKKKCVESSQSSAFFDNMVDEFPYHQICKDELITYEDVLLCTYSRVGTLKWLTDEKLLIECKKCKVCSSEMALQDHGVDSDWQDGFVWACKKDEQNPHYVCEVRKGSWFEHRSLGLDKIMRLTYMWCTGYPQDLIRHELKLSSSICVQWARYCREHAADICTKRQQMLGGEDCVIEVDILSVGERHSDSVIIESGQYLIGGSDIKNRSVFLSPIIKDTSKIIGDILKCWLNKGSVIFPVDWVPSQVFDEETLYSLREQYQFTFLIPSDTPRLGNIGTTWTQTKSALTAKGVVKQEYLWAYLGEYLWRRQSFHQDKFNQFIKYISEAYSSKLTETEDDTG